MTAELLLELCNNDEIEPDLKILSCNIYRSVSTVVSGDFSTNEC